MPDYAKLLQARVVKEQVAVILLFFFFFAVCKCGKLLHCSPTARLYFCRMFSLFCAVTGTIMMH